MMKPTFDGNTARTRHPNHSHPSTSQTQQSHNRTRTANDTQREQYSRDQNIIQ